MIGPLPPPGFAQVLHFHGASLRRAAMTWAELADQSRTRAQEVSAATRIVEDAWQGPAADHALRQTRRLQDTVDIARLPLRGHHDVLLWLADAGDRLRDRALDLLARAAEAGVPIDSDGRVGAPFDPHGTAAALVSAFRQEVSGLLAEAARLDAEAVRCLVEHAPWADGRARAFVATDTVPGSGSPPEAVNRWWHGLNPAQRRHLLLANPELIGPLDGLPATVRDQANRILLNRERARLRNLLADLRADRDQWRARLAATTTTPLVRLRPMPVEGPPPTAEQRAVEADLAALDRLERELAAGGLASARAYLLGLDISGGRLILALGDPDHAAHVLTYVPGTGSTPHNADRDLERTRRMVGDMAELAAGAPVAAIYWLGYDAPPRLVDATDLAPARSAADDLRRFAEGLREAHRGRATHTVVGHSYGSTVVGVTATGGLHADSLVFVGSPGVGAGSAAELDIDGDPRQQVWATTAATDPVQVAAPFALTEVALHGPATTATHWLLRGPDLVHGPNPARVSFGGQVFSSGWSSGHSGYWDEGNAARRTLAEIAVGQHASR